MSSCQTDEPPDPTRARAHTCSPTRIRNRPSTSTGAAGASSLPALPPVSLPFSRQRPRTRPFQPLRLLRRQLQVPHARPSLPPLRGVLPRLRRFPPLRRQGRHRRRSRQQWEAAAPCAYRGLSREGGSCGRGHSLCSRLCDSRHRCASLFTPATEDSPRSHAPRPTRPRRPRMHVQT